MGSDAQWQDENGFSREVRGDYSTVDFGGDSPQFGAYYSTYAAAAYIAKTFPGVKVEPNETRNDDGTITRRYWVDAQDYFDRLPAAELNDFVYDAYPAAVHEAQLLDAGF